jgi:hypothetical protein
MVPKICLGCLLIVGLALCHHQAAWADEPKAAADAAPSQAKSTDKARRVYLLHSGLHTILSDPAKNIAAETLRDGLLKRGVADKDVIVLENPFPYASWRSLLPFESIAMFFDSIEPGSKMSHDSYVRMHKALKAQGVAGKDDLVWIGHSAGGQIGLTMAHLAVHLAKFPELAKEAAAYHFDMVITLGAPVNSTHMPAEVKLRHYYSAQDKVVRLASRIGPWAALPFGYQTRIGKLPTIIGDNCMIRCFGDIEHPYWDETARVLDRILGETTADFRPPWHSKLGLARWGLSLSELMCRALEAECHISIEDPPKNK